MNVANAKAQSKLENTMRFLNPRDIRMMLVATILTSTACGGSNPEPKKPAPPPKQEVVSQDNEDDHAEEPKGPDCSDGSCFRCGKGICLPGFFCDESTLNANCQSLYKCARVASCGCIQEALGANCTCAEREGGFYVKCKG